MTTLIICTDKFGAERYYTAILAMLTDPHSPIRCSDRYFRELVDEQGWPVQYQGCVAKKDKAMSTSDARKKAAESRIL